jgi:hypothetical protein
MTSESGGDEERRFLLEPPAPGEITFQIAAGNEVEVSPEVQTAFAALVETLRGGEIKGYVFSAHCPNRIIMCKPNDGCGFEGTKQCFVDYICQIGKLS